MYFPGLHMTEQMQELLSLVGVERVSMPRDRSSLRIYLNSPRLIHKKNIWDLERGIREQLFLENRSRSESLNGSVCLSSIHRKSF